MPTQPSPRTDSANGLFDHGILYSRDRMDSVASRPFLHSTFSSASLEDDGDDDFDNRERLRIDVGSHASSDVWPSDGRVINDDREPDDKPPSIRRPVTRSCFPELPLNHKKVSPNLQEAKLSEFNQLVSSQDLFILSNSPFYDGKESPIRKTDTGNAQWNATNSSFLRENEASSNGSLQNTESRKPVITSTSSNPETPSCTQSNHCRKRSCNCEDTVKVSCDSEPKNINNSDASARETLPTDSADISISRDISVSHPLNVLLSLFTNEEKDLFNDLMDSTIDLAVQDLLREEMDEGHRPSEPTRHELDLMTNTWEDVFQNPFDYMLHAMDSCPKCGRQISLSRMAPHIVNKCGESRSVEERKKRMVRRERRKTRYSPLPNTQLPPEKPSPEITPLEQPSSSSVVDEEPELIEISVLTPRAQTSSTIQSAPVGSRIASISQKLLQRKGHDSALQTIGEPSKTISEPLKNSGELAGGDNADRLSNNIFCVRPNQG